MPLPSTTTSTTSTSPPCSPVTTTTTSTTTTRRTNKKASLLFTLKPPVLLSAPVRSSRSTLFVSNKNSSSFSGSSSSNKRNNNKKLPLEAIVLLFACASALVSFLILHSSAATAATTTTTTTSSTANHQPQQQQQQQQLNGHVETSSFHHHYQNYNNNNNNNNIPVFPHSDNPYSAVSLLAQTLPANAVIHSIHGTNMSHHNNNNINNSSSLSYAGTIVSAYFRLKSKYSSETYEQKWMQHFLSLQDPMVIYTARSSSSSTTSSNTTISSSTTTHQQQQQQQSPPDIVELIAQQRQHAPTVIIELQSLSDMPIAYLDYNNYNYNNNQNHSVSSNDNNNNNNKNNNTAFPFWEHQLQIDPERKRHQSYQLFWIWLSKTWFVQQAIQLNFFQSDFFVWSDIGCFRQQRNKQQYHGKLLLNDVAVIQQVMPDHQTLLWMAHHDTNPPPNGVWLWNNKYTQKQHFYHSGSQGAGYATAWTRFLPRLADTIDAFRTANNNNSSMFLGEDQCLLQATCLRFPDNCAYVPTKQVPDNHYFGLRHVLHHHHYKENQRGQQRPLPKYNLWRPPLTTTTFHKKNVSKTTAGV